MRGFFCESSKKKLKIWVFLRKIDEKKYLKIKKTSRNSCEISNKAKKMSILWTNVKLDWKFIKRQKTFLNSAVKLKKEEKQQQNKKKTLKTLMKSAVK